MRILLDEPADAVAHDIPFLSWLADAKLDFIVHADFVSEFVCFIHDDIPDKRAVEIFTLCPFGEHLDERAIDTGVLHALELPSDNVAVFGVIQAEHGIPDRAFIAHPIRADCVVDPTVSHVPMYIAVGCFDAEGRLMPDVIFHDVQRRLDGWYITELRHVRFWELVWCCMCDVTANEQAYDNGQF